MRHPSAIETTQSCKQYKGIYDLSMLIYKHTGHIIPCPRCQFCIQGPRAALCKVRNKTTLRLNIPLQKFICYHNMTRSKHHNLNDIAHHLTFRRAQANPSPPLPVCLLRVIGEDSKMPRPSCETPRSRGITLYPTHNKPPFSQICESQAL